jgi:hypothetical protein
MLARLHEAGVVRMLSIYKKPVGSADAVVLASILNRWCATNRLVPSDVQAKAKADELLHWFEHGIDDPKELSDLIHGTHWQVTAI